MSDTANASLESLLARVRELTAEGHNYSWAWGIADLENRIRNWPDEWGGDLQILIYGGFSAPPQPIVASILGITIHPEKLEGTIIRNSLTVLKATVKVAEKNIPGLVDAARRINVLLGSHTLVNWGNAECGWWSYVTHGTSGGVHSDLKGDEIIRAAESICTLPPLVRRKVDAALYWVRVPRRGILESYRTDLLAVYAGYWNALECLVDAVCDLRPARKTTKLEKQAAIDEVLRRQGGHLSVTDVASLYANVVSPGLVPKATHAFKICFPEHAEQYIHECFRIKPDKERLYNIRNAINHGDIDAENPTELLRIQTRLPKLWMIIWRMFGRLVAFSAPAENTDAKPTAT